MSSRVITQADIDRYNKLFPAGSQLHLANWFAKSAVTQLSNELCRLAPWYDGGHLRYGRAEGCRCGSCFEWQVVTLDDNDKERVAVAAEDLYDLIPRKTNEQAPGT